jgi:hypothetical protein
VVSELSSIFYFVSEKITNLTLIVHLIAVNYQLQLGDELIPIKYSITQLTSNIIPNKKSPSQNTVISLFFFENGTAGEAPTVSFYININIKKKKLYKAQS